MDRNISEPRRGRTAQPRWLAVAAITSALALGGCASTPPAPSAELRAAEQAIAGAERAQAMQHAGEELGQARTKLASANAAVDAEEMERAARLAQEARVDAELATARTAMLKARAANDELRRSTDVLVDELRRTQGEPR